MYVLYMHVYIYAWMYTYIHIYICHMGASMPLQGMGVSALLALAQSMTSFAMERVYIHFVGACQYEPVEVVTR